MENDFINTAFLKAGTDVYGIANIERFTNAPKGFHPTDIMESTKSVLVFGVQFNKSVFTAKSNSPYTLVRDKLVEKLDTISVDLAYKIEEQGYDAVPIPSGEPYEYWDEENRHGRGIMSLKHAAQLAGIGFIGKNTLLINPKFGNRLWLGAVLTNMPLQPDNITDKVCPPKCSICLDSCPQSALNGITINQKDCRKICFTFTPGGGCLINCNICRTVCPFSKV